MKDTHNYDRLCVVFFERKDGYIIVAPDSSRQTPPGYERRECRTLREVDALTARLNAQDRVMFQELAAKDLAIMRAHHERIRSRLSQRLLEPDCSPIETLFIRRTFEYLDKKEEELTKWRVRGMFVQREMDSKNALIDDYGKQIVMPSMKDKLAQDLSKR